MDIFTMFMKRNILPASEQSFVDDIRQIEQRLFADQFDPTDRMRMKSIGPYSWYYRPSHHAKTGLVTKADVKKRVLSVGAYPAYVERVLVELGMPAENILIADSNPEILDCGLPSIRFDMLKEWPEMEMFDVILFPESLCIAIADAKPKGDDEHAALLAHVMRNALQRVKPGGVIRANGPMSHPKIVQKMEELLNAEGMTVAVDYQRFFMSVRPID